MNRHTRLVFLCVITSVFFAPAVLTAQTGETYTLRQTYTPGTYYRVTNIDIRHKNTIGGEIDSDMNIQQILVMKMVISKSDEKGNKTVTITYERIQDTMNDVFGNVMEYDSKAPKDETLEQTYRPMLNAKGTVVLDKQNNIISIQGVEGIWDQTQKEHPDLIPLIQHRKKYFNREFLDRMMQAGKKLFPAKPIAVGTSWEGKYIATTSFGEIVLPQKMTFVSVEKEEERQKALVVFSGKEENIIQDKKQPDTSATPKASEDIQWKGMLRFDIEAGRFCEMNMLVTSVVSSVKAKGTDTVVPTKKTTKLAIAMKEYVNEIPPELAEPPASAPSSASAPVEE